MVSLTGLLYLVEVLDVASGEQLERHGIVPRDLGGLEGVLWAPLLHDDWAHLSANTLPFLVLGFLVLANGVRQFVAVTATIWLVGGLAVWLLGPAGTDQIGASGIVFGWLGFLLVRGLFTGGVGQIVLGVVLLFGYGGVLVGVLPLRAGLSWQGHLFGALTGVVAARLAAQAERGRVGPP